MAGGKHQVTLPCNLGKIFCKVPSTTAPNTLGMPAMTNCKFKITAGEDLGSVGMETAPERCWSNWGFCHLSFLKLDSLVLVRLRLAESTKLALVVIRTRGLGSKGCFNPLVNVILRVTFHAGAH